MPISASREKPVKPYEEYPLTPHPCGQWAKRINRRLYYFGPWEDWEHALAVYMARIDDIRAGRLTKSRVTLERQSSEPHQGITVGTLVNHFLTAKNRAVERAELKRRTFGEYQSVCVRMTAEFGKTQLVSRLAPADFAKLKDVLAQGVKKKVWIGELSKRIGIARSVFLYGKENHLHSEVFFGSEFVRPNKKQMRQDKAKRRRSGKMQKLFTSDEIRMLLDEASVSMRAMIFLAINGGMGNTDIAEMTFHVLKLDQAMIDYPRPKSGIERKILLWPETVRAMREAIESRPKPATTEFKDIVLLTQSGNLWTRYAEKYDEQGRFVKGTAIGPLTSEFGRLMDTLGIRQKGRNFYALRHTFRTLVDD
ncbi:MAG TPA: hypothetical protein PKY77_24840, partial [Phycisphaerae bacterium]|nr:hypothetical protein [Phycisphaerae bacterium]